MPLQSLILIKKEEGSDDMSNYSLIDVAAKFKSGLLAKATNGEYNNKEFRADMDILLADMTVMRLCAC